MKIHLRWDGRTVDFVKHLVVGREYWAFVAQLNGKSTGLMRNVKPFRVTLTEINASRFETHGWWDWPDFDWDLSNCPKPLKQGRAELYFSGSICESEAECIEEYNKFLLESVRLMKARMSRKYNAEYIKAKTDSVMKNTIKIDK